MSTKTTLTYICDGCGRESDASNFCNGAEAGRSDFRMVGHRSLLSAQGDWGGANHNVEIDLCFDCSEKVQAF